MLFAKEGVIVRDFGVVCTTWRGSARFLCYLHKKALQCEISVLNAQDGAVVRDFGVVCIRWRGSARFRCYLQKKAL